MFLKLRYLRVVDQTPLDYLPANPLTQMELMDAQEIYIDPAMTELEDFGEAAEVVAPDATPIDSEVELTELADVKTPKSLEISPRPSQS